MVTFFLRLKAILEIDLSILDQYRGIEKRNAIRENVTLLIFNCHRPN